MIIREKREIGIRFERCDKEEMQESGSLVRESKKLKDSISLTTV